jgi:hypothetical protein
MRNNPKDDLEFAINSNMGIPRRNLDKFCQQVDDLLKTNKIKKADIFTSIDTWGAQAEWIRNGLNIEKYEDNLHYYMNNVYNSSFSFMITFCLLSIPRFNLLLDKILEFRQIYNNKNTNRQRINFDTPNMIEPPHLTALIADDYTLNLLRKHLDYMESLVDDSDINKFTTTEFLKLKRVVEWVENNRYKESELNLHRSDFAKFVDEHDRRRNTDWHSAFPELHRFYKKCSELSYEK